MLAEGEQPSSPWNRRLPKSTMGYWKRSSVLLIMLPAHTWPADRARCLLEQSPLGFTAAWLPDLADHYASCKSLAVIFERHKSYIGDTVIMAAKQCCLSSSAG